jgi:fatty acid desaturase
VQFVFATTLILVGFATSSWDIAEGLIKSGLAYFGVYVYGLGSLTVFVAALRSIAEHQQGNVTGVDVGRAALRNLKCNPLTRLIFGAYGFAEHAAHHQWPGLPSYQLEQATKILAEKDLRMTPHQGYMAVLSTLWLE